MFPVMDYIAWVTYKSVEMLLLLDKNEAKAETDEACQGSKMSPSIFRYSVCEPQGQKLINLSAFPTKTVLNRDDNPDCFSFPVL